ncbi:MAG: hypothetical protein WBA12_14250 [Catalinimonas sp.]
MKNWKHTLFLLAGFGLLTACNDDDPDPVNEEEVITTVEMVFTEVGNTANTFSIFFKDPDGDGGNAPTQQDSIILAPNTTYNVSIKLLDESDPNDVEDITKEIEEEDDEHFFCFDPSANLNVTVNRTDTDGTYEVGLVSDWVTGDASVGSLTMTLRHQPMGAKDGTCGPGDTDVTVTFGTAVR